LMRRGKPVDKLTFIPVQAFYTMARIWGIILGWLALPLLCWGSGGPRRLAPCSLAQRLGATVH
jgi:hypothetical protein